MSLNIKNIVNYFCYDGNIIEVDNINHLVLLTASNVSVRYEASPKSSQIMINKTILLDNLTGNQYEIKPIDLQILFKRDGTVEKSPTNPITALTIFEQDNRFTHIIQVQDGLAKVYSLEKLKVEAQTIIEQVEAIEFQAQEILPTESIEDESLKPVPQVVKMTPAVKPQDKTKIKQKKNSKK